MRLKLWNMEKNNLLHCWWWDNGLGLVNKVISIFVKIFDSKQNAFIVKERHLILHLRREFLFFLYLRICFPSNCFWAPGSVYEICRSFLLAVYGSSPRLKSLVTMGRVMAVAAETPPMWHDCCHMPPLTTAISFWVAQVVCREVPPLPELKSSDPSWMLFATVLNLGGFSESRKAIPLPSAMLCLGQTWTENVMTATQQ